MARAAGAAQPGRRLRLLGRERDRRTRVGHRERDAAAQEQLAVDDVLEDAHDHRGRGDRERVAGLVLVVDGAGQGGCCPGRSRSCESPLMSWVDCVPGASPSRRQVEGRAGLERDGAGELPRPQPAEGPVGDLQGPGVDRAVHLERAQEHVDRTGRRRNRSRRASACRPPAWRAGRRR